ncbi:nuclear transport factor 2 family protein [Rhodococcus sp. IEGM 1381]|uniref:nuclear transport factor 2 family protein n=1 Tax=Rhodococcus sp. IEGM 1381 TaxID=3047085 RepID=UPI0024B7C79F|nr:nuclear transport factor 2 family protein [Rhodococcus sp. IEGM 1381]MDI9894501.1 nuclear transport factor 2 family protein [Rhodococcus sp. IEGM 1381]
MRGRGVSLRQGRTVAEARKIDRYRVEVPVQALFNGIGNDFKPSTPNSAIVTVDIVGTVASARVDSDNLDGFRFSDFFHLLEADGEWQIVAKTFHTHSTTTN